MDILKKQIDILKKENEDLQLENIFLSEEVKILTNKLEKQYYIYE